MEKSPVPLVLALAVLLQAQGLQVQTPVFRGGVDYVELDVVITDGHDVAVKDLTKDEFRITERGREQRIADFRFEYVFAPLFWGSSDTSADVTIAVRADGTSPASVTRLAGSPAGRRREARLDTTVPLRALPPGHFVLEVTARLTSGQTARREIAFEIK